SEGGAAVAIAESLFGTNGLGADVKLSGNETSALFAETQSRFILSVKKEHQEAFEQLVEDATFIGEVTNSGQLTIEGSEKQLIDSNVKSLEDAWKGAIPCLLT